MDFTINQAANLQDQVKNASMALSATTLGNATVAEKCITSFIAGKPSDFRKSVMYVRPAKQLDALTIFNTLSMAAIGDMVVTKFYESIPLDVPTVGMNDRKGLLIRFTYQPTNTPTRATHIIKVPYLNDSLTDAQIDAQCLLLLGCLSPLDFPDIQLGTWSRYLC